MDRCSGLGFRGLGLFSGLEVGSAHKNIIMGQLACRVYCNPIRQVSEALAKHHHVV